MVILLAVLVVGGLVWLTRRDRRTGTAAEVPPPVLPVRSPGGQPIPAERLAQGRIVVSGLTKEYGGATVVDGLSFVVEPGRVTGFLGPNGAGKTTTLRMLLGLVEPTRGSASIGGARYADLAEPIRRVGSVLEASGVYEGRTGRDHLRIICRAACVPVTRADEVLELTGLGQAGHRLVRGYSLGMRQRLGIAAALLGDPQVLVLDEPANGLDPEGIRWMRDLLRALASGGRTVLVSSHLLAEMEQLADDLIIIASGRLVAHGSVASVTGSMGAASRTLVRTPQVSELAAALGGGVTVTPASAGDVYITGADATEIGETARRVGIAIHQLVTQHPDLEATFLELTTGKAAIR